MRRTASGSRAAVLLSALLIGALCTACAGRSETRPPLLVIGVDGLEWAILQPLLDAGEMPNVARLVDGGVAGRLQTLEPTLSPIIWTTIATGKPPAAHGITGFTRTDEDGRERLFTPRDRQVKAIWNVLSEGGRTVDVVGWWTTWPAEQVEGVMVSQSTSLAQGQRVWKGTVREGLPGQCWPVSLCDEIAPLVRAARDRFPDALGGAPATGVRVVFGDLPGELTEYERRLVGDSIWSLRADATYTDVAVELLRRRRADVTLVYLGSPDVVGHRFFRHYRPEAYAHPPAAVSVTAFGGVIPAAYRFIDGLVGRLLDAAAAAGDVDVVLLSDHGMVPVNVDKDFEAAYADESHPYRRLAVNTGHHLAAEDGVLILSGPSFAGAVPGGGTPADMPRASVFDIAPTVLALTGVPVGQDMTGRVLRPWLADSRREEMSVRFVPTWEGGSPHAALPLEGMDEERLRQLRGLGYID